MNDFIINRLIVGELSANCYVVGSVKTGSGVVVDPGDDINKIISAIDSSLLKIKWIILTHGHSDHIAALYEIRRHTGALVAIHKADSDFLCGRGEYSMMFGIAYRTPAPADRLLNEGDILEIDNLGFKVIHTPGHTPGSICLQMSNKIFTGDTLMYRGIGTTLMPGSSRRQLVESIRSRLMDLPDETILYPGHGRQTTIGEERRNNPYINR